MLKKEKLRHFLFRKLLFALKKTNFSLKLGLVLFLSDV